MTEQDAKTDWPLERTETLVCSGDASPAKVSVLIPTYKDDPSPLLDALSIIEGAHAFELIVFDDGSGDSFLSGKVAQAIGGFPGPFAYIASSENRGRSHVRNRLGSLATTDWLLFIDADMLPDSPRFLANYLRAIIEDSSPRLIVGGLSVAQTKRTRNNALHYSQSVAADTPGVASRRAAPGRYVFTSNVIVHRSVIEAVDFDPAFKGWGWEDVDWGLTIQKQFAIDHIDNPASHLGLLSNATLIKRFESSGENYRRLMAKHPEVAALPLSRAMALASRLPFKGLLSVICRTLATDRLGLTPMPLRRICLKLLRAIAYSKVPAIAKPSKT